MKVYILLENANDHGVEPDELDDIVLGVFVDQKKAQKCLKDHADYIKTQSNIELFFEDGKAFDESGVIFLEIVERDVE